MKHLKSAIALLLVFVMVFALFACNADDTETQGTTKKTTADNQNSNNNNNDNENNSNSENNNDNPPAEWLSMSADELIKRNETKLRESPAYKLSILSNNILDGKKSASSMGVWVTGISPKTPDDISKIKFKIDQVSGEDMIVSMLYDGSTVYAHRNVLNNETKEKTVVTTEELKNNYMYFFTDEEKTDLYSLPISYIKMLTGSFSKIEKVTENGSTYIKLSDISKDQELISYYDNGEKVEINFERMAGKIELDANGILSKIIIDAKYSYEFTDYETGEKVLRTEEMTGTFELTLNPSGTISAPADADKYTDTPLNNGNPSVDNFGFSVEDIDDTAQLYLIQAEKVVDNKGIDICIPLDNSSVAIIQLLKSLEYNVSNAYFTGNDIDLCISFGDETKYRKVYIGYHSEGNTVYIANYEFFDDTLFGGITICAEITDEQRDMLTSMIENATSSYTGDYVDIFNGSIHYDYVDSNKDPQIPQNSLISIGIVHAAYEENFSSWHSDLQENESEQLVTILTSLEFYDHEYLPQVGDIAFAFEADEYYYEYFIYNSANDFIYFNDGNRAADLTAQQKAFIDQLIEAHDELTLSSHSTTQFYKWNDDNYAEGSAIMDAADVEILNALFARQNWETMYQMSYGSTYSFYDIESDYGYLNYNYFDDLNIIFCDDPVYSGATLSNEDKAILDSIVAKYEALMT